jgi:hypothetical protein
VSQKYLAAQHNFRNAKISLILFQKYFYIDMNFLPLQPPEHDWHFVQDLQSPLWTKHHWKKRAASQNEVSLANGVFINGRFPDAAVLETAYQDLRDFLAVGDIPIHDSSGESTFCIKPCALDETDSADLEEFLVLAEHQDGKITYSCTEF